MQLFETIFNCTRNVLDVIVNPINYRTLSHQVFRFKLVSDSEARQQTVDSVIPGLSQAQKGPSLSERARLRIQQPVDYTEPQGYNSNEEH